MSQKPFNELPLSVTPLDALERQRWLDVINPLLAYGGSPGDWGYNSKLGRLIQVLHQVRTDIQSGEKPEAT